MKKTAKKHDREDQELRSDYRFDYRRSRPNRFAASFRKGNVAVVLDPDVAAVFHSSATVNALLRSVIAAFPKAGRRSRKAS